MALAAAWTPTTPQRAHALLRSTATEFVTEATAAQVFGRLADKKLLLDVEGAGTPESMSEAQYIASRSEAATRAF